MCAAKDKRPLPLNTAVRFQQVYDRLENAQVIA